MDKLDQARAFRAAGDHGAAAGLCREVLAADPGNAEALVILGAAHAYRQEWPEAIACFDTALGIVPTHEDAWLSRGDALASAGRFDDAVENYEDLLDVRPDSGPAHFHLARALFRVGRFDEAAELYRLMRGIIPGDAALLANMAPALFWAGDPVGAIAVLDQAIAISPGRPEARFSRGMMRLTHGDFVAGLADFEARLELDGAARPPVWNGSSPLTGKTILLRWEQGFGDTIQFCRYARLAAAAGGQVVLEVQEKLARLMTTLPGVTRIVAAGQPLPPFDLFCPMMSLPRAFGTAAAAIPAEVPYLRADPAVSAVWAGRLPQARGKRIGLVWAGHDSSGLAESMARNLRRSVGLAALAPLARVAGCEFVSLQMGLPARETGMALLDPTDWIGDFADTAALIDRLDLVIGVDTAVVHLAGAMGKPVWLLNRFDTDWRWFLNRDDSPWYPTMRQFRQPAPGEWAPAIARVAAALTEFAAA